MRLAHPSTHVWETADPILHHAYIHTLPHLSTRALPVSPLGLLGVVRSRQLVPLGRPAQVDDCRRRTPRARRGHDRRRRFLARGAVGLLGRGGEGGRGALDEGEEDRGVALRVGKGGWALGQISMGGREVPTDKSDKVVLTDSMSSISKIVFDWARCCLSASGDSVPRHLSLGWRTPKYDSIPASRLVCSALPYSISEQQGQLPMVIRVLAEHNPSQWRARTY